MKAIVIRAPGGLERLEPIDLPDPVPGDGEVLVEVAFAGCNWADTQMRAGTYSHPVTYPLVPGFELSGRVAGLGAGVGGLRMGDRVAGIAGKAGAYAEKCVVPANLLIPLADSISLEAGAAFPIQAFTAYHMLHTVHRIRPGDTVLMHAVGGGVGLMVTQLAVRAGARVIGTVGTPGKERRALDYGAERVVITANENFEAPVLAFTSGKGVDLAIDSLGADILDRTFNVVRKLGHIVSIGEAAGAPPQNIRERLMVRSQTFTRLNVAHVDPESQAWSDGVAHVVRGVIEGWLRVPIEGVFPFADVAAMHRRLESRQVSGKLLLAVGP